MSRVVVCPSRPERWATTPDGRRVVTTDGPECVCGQTCRYYRYVRCGTILCPPCEPPPETWVCRATPPPAGHVILCNASSAANQCSLQACYRYDGDDPLPDPPPGAASCQADAPLSNCGSPECNPDLCDRYIELRPCTGPETGGVYATREAVRDCAAFTVLDQTGSPVCYCPTATAVPVLPPGAVLAQGDADTCRGCCACRYLADRSRGVPIPDCAWGIGPQPIANPRGCCCGRFLSLNATMTATIGADTYTLGNRQNCRRRAPNGFVCDYDVLLNASTVVGRMGIVFFCGGTVGIDPALPSPMPPVAVTLLFTTLTTVDRRTCFTWESSPNIGYGSASVNVGVLSSGCEACGSSINSPLLSPGDAGCGSCGGAADTLRSLGAEPE